jgi:hypothetical protein
MAQVDFTSNILRLIFELHRGQAEKDLTTKRAESIEKTIENFCARRARNVSGLFASKFLEVKSCLTQSWFSYKLAIKVFVN